MVLILDLVLNLYAVCIFKLCSDNCVVAYWEIAVHSAYDLFLYYKYLIVNSAPPWFFELEFLSDCGISLPLSTFSYFPHN